MVRPLLTPPFLSAAACAPPPPPPAAPTPPPMDKEAPPPETKTVEVPEPVSKAPVVPTRDEMARLVPGEGLEAQLENFTKKNYFAAIDELAPELEKAQRGQHGLDEKVQILAMLGQAHDMMGEKDRAAQMYRRVLGEWRRPNALLKRIDKGDAGDEARRQRLFDAFGEALFYLGEQRREGLSELEIPYYAGGEDPKEVSRFVTRDLSQWLGKRDRVILRAAKEYGRIDDLGEHAPARWRAAAASRIGAMHALALQAMRDLPEGLRTAAGAELEERMQHE